MNTLQARISQYSHQILRISVLLIIVGIAMQAAYIFVPSIALPHRPFEEDTFFHLSVCRNIAAGKGMTIDGKIPTSGAQPGTLIYTLAYLYPSNGVGDLPLRLVRLISVIGSLLSTVAVYYASSQLFSGDEKNRRSLALLSAALWTASYQVFRTNLNGYETVFAVTALLVSIGAYLQRWRASTRLFPRDILVGITMAIAIYCRIDLGIWAATAALWFIFRGSGSLSSRFISTVTWGIIALILTLPFWINNLLVGGSIMPISGKASAFQMTFHGLGASIWNCLIRSFTSIGEFPWISLYLPYGSGGSIFGISVAIGGFALFFYSLFSVTEVREYWRATLPPRALYGVAIFLILLLGYYVAAHGSWWFIKRYMHPLRAVFFALSGLYAISIAWSISTKIRKPDLFYSLLAGVVTLVLTVSIVQFAMTWGDTKSNQMYPVAKWINANLPPNVRIGAFQSGTLGYFCPNIVNLDGKNNPYVLQRLLKGETMDYIREEKFDYVIDWPSQIADYVDFGTFEKFYQPIDHVGAAVVYKLRD